MQGTFEQLTPDLQDTILGVTEMVNAKVHPPEWTYQVVRILKPFTWERLSDDATAGEMPHWSAHYHLIEGKWVFKFLSE